MLSERALMPNVLKRFHHATSTLRVGFWVPVPLVPFGDGRSGLQHLYERHLTVGEAVKSRPGCRRVEGGSAWHKPALSNKVCHVVQPQLVPSCLQIMTGKKVDRVFPAPRVAEGRV